MPDPADLTSSARDRTETRRLVWPRSEPHPGNDAAVARAIRTHGDQFSFATAAIVTALRQEREVTIALNVADAPGAAGRLAAWRCTRGRHGIELLPLDVGAAPIGANVEPGDALVACDPWGEAEPLFHAVRASARRGAVTIAITGDRPNLLAAQATHAIRAPIEPPARPNVVVTVLRHLVQSAGASLLEPQAMPAWRRVGLL